jgi:MSHA biogenesis protein MshI
VELKDYTKKLKDRIRGLAQLYLQPTEQLSITDRCCISITPNELSIIVIHQQQTLNEVTLLKKLKFDDLKSLSLVLKGIVQTNHLTETPVYWMLGPDEYQLNLIESMPVPASEMTKALAWRIRSLISYPIEEAVLEYFELPEKKNSQNTPLIAAVTAQKTALQPVINLLEHCGLNLVTIDIPELAMLNLTALYENDEKCSAFLYFYKASVILNISCKKTLYFTRRITVPRTTDTIDYEKLSLEILRYFDFFRSQWRLSSPTRIFAATESGDIEIISKALSERLLNTVSPYTFTATLLNDTHKTEIAGKYLLDYGSLLRKDGSYVTSGN